LNEILSENFEDPKKSKIEVNVLVRVLNNTITFENHLHFYLASEFESFSKGDNALKDDKSEKSGSELFKGQEESMNINDIKRKYEEVDNQKKRQDPNKAPRYNLLRIKGLISESFEQYMNSYVKIEEKKLKDIINGLQQGDRIEGKLYVSSLHLFNNIKQAMNRCLSFSNSKTFFDLSRMFKDIIKYYTELILEAKYPRNRNMETLKLTEIEMKILVYCINTCDYCVDTISALTDSLKDKMDEKFQNQVSR